MRYLAAEKYRKCDNIKIINVGDISGAVRRRQERHRTSALEAFRATLTSCRGFAAVLEREGGDLDVRRELRVRKSPA
jgi:hypothetical protein